MPAQTILSSIEQLGGFSKRLAPIQQLFELICPCECAWCESSMAADQAAMCESCLKLFTAEFHSCQSCGTQLPSTMPTESCARCRKARFGFDRVLALGPYRRHFQQAVLLSKKRQYEDLRHSLAGLLASKLADSLSGGGPSEDSKVELASWCDEPLLIPVPDHWTRKLNTSRAMTSATLAQEIGRRLELPVSERIVRRIRNTSKQGLLPWSQRDKNVRGAFQIVNAEALKGRHVVLVDDVLTSGATASEIGKNLREAAVSSVTVLVIARGTGVRE